MECKEKKFVFDMEKFAKILKTVRNLSVLGMGIFGFGMVNCDLSFCPFLVISDKKRTKRNAVQGGKVLQNSAKHFLYFTYTYRIFCNPLPLEKPPLRARLRRASDEVILVVVDILICEVFCERFKIDLQHDSR